MGRKLTDSISALGVPRNIVLEGEDEAAVKPLLEENTDQCVVVTLQPKITVRGQVIFSMCLKRVKKRNSYTIAFTNPGLAPAKHNFGRVIKFLSCPADSTDSFIHVAIIEQVRVEACRELLNLSYPPEIKHLGPILSDDFVSIVSEYHENVAIPVEHILFKCFDISTEGFSCLTTLVNESEVAK